MVQFLFKTSQAERPVSAGNRFRPQFQIAVYSPWAVPFPYHCITHQNITISRCSKVNLSFISCPYLNWSMCRGGRLLYCAQPNLPLKPADRPNPAACPPTDKQARAANVSDFWFCLGQIHCLLPYPIDHPLWLRIPSTSGLAGLSPGNVYDGAATPSQLDVIKPIAPRQRLLQTVITISIVWLCHYFMRLWD